MKKQPIKDAAKKLNSSSRDDAPLLPKVAAEDQSGAWGDHESVSNDEWLQQQRPPHWE